MDNGPKRMLFLNLGDVQMGLYLTRKQLQYIESQVRVELMELDASEGKVLPYDRDGPVLGGEPVKVRIAE